MSKLMFLFIYFLGDNGYLPVIKKKKKNSQNLKNKFLFDKISIIVSNKITINFAI